LKVYVGENCPDWATPDTGYAAWALLDNWTTNYDRTIALLKEAPRQRATDMAAGLDAYRRRVDLFDGSTSDPTA
jgi:hypothetical protein